VSAMLAGHLHWRFADGDEFHLAANAEKMRSGVPLTDDDRWPWRRTIAAWMDERVAQGLSAVIPCSALKRSYRDILLAGRPEARLIFLSVDREVLASRLAARHGISFPGSSSPARSTPLSRLSRTSIRSPSLSTQLTSLPTRSHRSSPCSGQATVMPQPRLAAPRVSMKLKRDLDNIQHSSSNISCDSSGRRDQGKVLRSREGLRRTPAVFHSFPLLTFAVRIECTVCGHLMLFNACRFRTEHEPILVRDRHEEDGQLRQ
jgi:hypothetical protein